MMDSSTSTTPAEPPSALRREVGLLGAVAMGLGSIVGTGVFVGIGVAAGVVGSGVLVAIVLAGLLALANGLSSAQLAAAHPVSGGTYEYGYRFLHPWAGFSAGFMYLLAKSASAATAALGAAGYLFHALGADDQIWPQIGVALALIAAVTALVSGGIKRSNLANLALVTLTLATLTCFVVFGIASIDPSEMEARIGMPSLWRALRGSDALVQAVGLVFVAYTGYGRIATLGEEVIAPRRTIPRAILITLGVTALLYASVAFTALATGGTRMFVHGTLHNAAPLEIIARTFDNPWVAKVVSVGAISAMVGVLFNLVLGVSRVMFAMARRGDAPRALDVVHESTGSPRRAVLATGALIALIAAQGSVAKAWSFSALTVLVYYGLTNLAALRLPDEHRLYPRFVSVAGLLGCIWCAIFLAAEDWWLGLWLLLGAFVIRAVAMRVRRVKE